MSNQARIVERSAAGSAGAGRTSQQSGRTACQEKRPAIRRAGAPSVDRARGTAPLEVVHEIAGRVRLRVPALRKNHALGERVAAELGGQPGIRAVRVAAACASVVVTYDRGRVTVLQIERWLGALVPPAVRSGPHEDRAGAGPLLLGAVSLGLGLLGAPAILTAGLALVGTARGVLSETDVLIDPLDVAEIGLELLRGGAGAAALSAGLLLGLVLLRRWWARRLSRPRRSPHPAPAAGGR